jgi:hypothetical protein
MNRPEGLPTVDQLVEGQVYRIYSRNLVIGVWVPHPEVGFDNGFIGIREKFGDEYLDSEYHHDTGGHYGTVRAAEPILVDGTPLKVPDGIPLRERLGTVCTVHRLPVEFRDNVREPATRPDGSRVGRGAWFHVDEEQPMERPDGPISVSNTALYDLLKPLSDAEYDRIHVWTEPYNLEQWAFQDDCWQCRELRDTFMDWVGTMTGMHLARDHMRLEHNIVYDYAKEEDIPLTKKQRRIKAQEALHAKIRRLEEENSTLRSRATGLLKLDADLIALCDEYDRQGSIPIPTLRLLRRHAMGGF